MHVRNVHGKYSLGQTECTPDVVQQAKTPVHYVYMSRTKPKAKKPVEREPTWRRTNMWHWRKHNRLTQEGVAEILGITHVTVGRWENGTSPPDAVMLEALAVLYKTDIHSMLNKLPVAGTKKTS